MPVHSMIPRHIFVNYSKKMASGFIVKAENVTIKNGGVTIISDINFSIKQGEQWAVVGNSGSGKTSLAHALVGRLFYTGTIEFEYPKNNKHNNSILLIEQQHRFKNRFNTSDFYYQQRFNSSDADNAMTVSEALQEYGAGSSPGIIKKWIELLHLAPLLNEPLIQLSNGENKRLQIAEALLSDPFMLIMDNPFIGLDIEGRETLNTIMENITSNGIHLILITNPQQLPACITHVAVLESHSLTSYRKENYEPEKQQPAVTSYPPIHFERLEKLNNSTKEDFDTAIKMINVSVQYGDKKILDTINWEVKRGDCWNVSGPNGAGKSTLLSLVTADNPQAYANEIYLFDKRKGRGESIWDIKKKIGYVSPELHLFFEKHNSAFEVVASGLFDTIGLFRQLSAEDEHIVNEWMDVMNLQSVKRKLLSQLSLGEQRMVLLARALVKNPPLLILDEPCQGLDDEQAGKFKNFTDQLCRYFRTTLLYVSHYQKDIPSCVTNYLRLENGKQV